MGPLGNLSRQSRLLLAVGLALGLTGASACAKAEAKTPGPAPIMLTVPDPPYRMNLPVTAEPPPPAPVTAEKPAPPSAIGTKPRPTPSPTPTAPPATTGTDTTPPPVVQTGDQTGQEAKARERLKAAENDLAKVQRRALGREAQEQFDMAQRYVRLTKDALTVKNYPFAASCADKAATLAALLVKAEPL